MDAIQFMLLTRIISLWSNFPYRCSPFRLLLRSLEAHFGDTVSLEVKHLMCHSYLSFSGCAQQTNPMRPLQRHHPLQRRRLQEPRRQHVYLTHDVVRCPQIKRDGAVEPLTQEPRVEQSEIRDSQRREERTWSLWTPLAASCAG